MAITIDEVFQLNINLLLRAEQAEQKVRELTAENDKLTKELAAIKAEHANHD